MPHDPDYSRMTLAILAGGRGRRMGVPKAHLQIAGRPILDYLLDQFCWTGERLLVTAPGLQHPPGWEQFDREAVDSVADDGPLRGALTALQNAANSMIVIATLDMPCVRAEHLRWSLRQLAARSDCVGFMFRRPVEGRDQIEPFPFACRVGAAGAVSSFLAAGERAVHRLLDEPGFISEPAPDHWPASVWTNLNRPEELRKFVESID